MSGLKEIKNRITSIGSTIQITSAMKMVSAAKLKKAQDSITQMRPYADKLQELLQNLCAATDVSENPFAEQREVNNVLIVAVSSNRGLCGAFNSSIIKQVNHLVQNDFAGKNIEVLSIGKKGNDLLSKFLTIAENRSDLWDDLSFDAVAEIAEKIMNQFLEDSFDKVVVVYNKFINAANQSVQVEQFLPVVLPEAEGVIETDYIYEPNQDSIVRELIPKSLKTQLFKGVLDSHASEHGARMTSMHKATDNANELKDELTLTYNKARQAAITKEILEIVGGAEALNG